MFANRLFALSVLLGATTTLFGILSLSLNYWQGKTLTGKEIMKLVYGFMNIESANGGSTNGGSINGVSVNGGSTNGGSIIGGSTNGGYINGGSMNVGQNPSEGYSGEKVGSFSDMKNAIFEETGPDYSAAYDAVYNLHGGIWHLCFEVVEIPSIPGLFFPEVCVSLLNAAVVYSPVWPRVDWNVPRAMLFLGIFCILGCTGCILVRWFTMQEKHILLTVAAGLAIVAGIFFLAGFSYFADSLKVDFFDYQSAFYFCILSWLLSWVTAGIIIQTRISNYDISAT